MRLLLLIFLITTFTAFAGDLPIRINDTLSVSDSIQPNNLTTDISVTVQTSAFASASALMERVSSVVKEHSAVCANNSYRVSPLYTYKNSSKSLDGFQGSMNIPCTFDELPLFNAFINDLESLGKAFTLSMNPLVWVVSPDLRDDVLITLKTSALSQAFILESKYSASTGKKCSLTDINYTLPSAPFRPSAMLMRSESINVSAPDLTDADISLTANIILVCK